MSEKRTCGGCEHGPDRRMFVQSCFHPNKPKLTEAWSCFSSYYVSPNTDATRCPGYQPRAEKEECEWLK